MRTPALILPNRYDKVFPPSKRGSSGGRGTQRRPDQIPSNRPQSHGPRPVRLVWSRTPPFHGGNRGSNPLRDAIPFVSRSTSPGLARKRNEPRPRPGPEKFRTLDVLLGSYFGSLRTFAALAGLVLDLLPFGQRPESFRINIRVMHKQVITAILGCDKSIPFLIAKPLHCTRCHCLLLSTAPHGTLITSPLLFKKRPEGCKTAIPPFRQ